MKAIITGSIVSLFIGLNAHAATDNLQPFTSFSGDYTISSESGPYCQNAFQSLQLVVNADEQTVTEIFEGEGTLNGLPTAGQYAISVSKENTRELPSLNGRRLERVVIEKQTITTQESLWAPLYGFFGKWENTGAILKFEKSGSVIVHRSGFSCLFNRN